MVYFVASCSTIANSDFLAKDICPLDSEKGSFEIVQAPEMKEKRHNDYLH